jgi:hypothetical protein
MQRGGGGVCVARKGGNEWSVGVEGYNVESKSTNKFSEWFVPVLFFTHSLFPVFPFLP